MVIKNLENKIKLVSHWVIDRVHNYTTVVWTTSQPT